VGEELALELGGFDGRGLDSAGEAAHNQSRRVLVGVEGAGAAETAAALDKHTG
jgi:hypothetical protein